MLVASRHFLLPLAVFLSGVRSAHGAVVTLYYVSQPATATGPILPSGTSFSFETGATIVASVLGPGDAGMTRYEIQEIQTKLVLHEPQTTVTLIDSDSPLTITYTVEQGASTAYNSMPPLVTQEASGQVRYLGSRQNCTLDISKKTGSCVEEDQSPSLVLKGDSPSTAIATSSRTVTGPLLPLATITLDSSGGGSGGGGGGSSGSGSGSGSGSSGGGSSGGSTSDASRNSRVMDVRAVFLLSAMLVITIF